MNGSLPWWEWGPARRHLAVWTGSLLRGRRRRVWIAAGGAGSGEMGWESPTTIFVNPAAIAECTGDPPHEVWGHARAIAAHEVGHCRFTGELEGGSILFALCNMLEDERIERAMAAAYPYLAEDFDRVGTAVHRRLTATDNGPQGVVGACLCWRWEHDHPELVSQIALSEEWRAVWDGRVRPLVEEAWGFARFDDVVANARAILAILGLPEDAPAVGLPALGFGESSGSPDAEDIGVPGAGGGADGPGLEMPPNEGGLAPYLDLERIVEGPAGRLAELLRVRAEPAGWVRAESGGRYSMRQALRTPDEPFRVRQEHQVGDVTFGLLLDVSGSMSGQMGELVAAAMMVVSACEAVAIPLWLGAFGSNYRVLRQIHEDSPRSWARAKALTAGLECDGGTAMLEPLRVMAHALQTSPNPLGLVVTDGHPDGGENDGIRALTAEHTWLWGCYVGQEERHRARDLAALGDLFQDRTIEGQVSTLPAQIGHMLRSVRRRRR